MKNKTTTKILAAAAIFSVVLLAHFSTVEAQISGGTGGGIGSAQFWKLVGTQLQPVNSSEVPARKPMA